MFLKMAFLSFLLGCGRQSLDNVSDTDVDIDNDGDIHNNDDNDDNNADHRDLNSRDNGKADNQFVPFYTGPSWESTVENHSLADQL